jgi:hypothetical protein
MRAHHAEVDAGVAVAAGRRRAAPALAAMLALLACAPALADGQEFSAEAAYVTAPVESKGKAAVPVTSSAKLYVSKDKMRIDFAGLSSRSLIVDDGRRTIMMLYHDRKAYQALGSRPAEYFRVADAEDACPAWQQAVGKPIRCQKSGAEIVAGRRAVKYVRPAVDGGADEIWVDPTLKYVVKWRIDTVEMELHDISEGPQAAELFVVPGGYVPLGPQKTSLRQARRP